MTDWTLDCILDVEISKIQDKYDWGMNYTQNTKIMTRFKGKNLNILKKGKSRIIKKRLLNVSWKLSEQVVWYFDVKLSFTIVHSASA